MDFPIFFFPHLFENAVVKQYAVFGGLGWCFAGANIGWLHAACHYASECHV